MRIKVTAYIEPEDLAPEMLDEDHEMGLSNEGFEAFAASASLRGNGAAVALEDIEFERVED